MAASKPLVFVFLLCLVIAIDARLYLNPTVFWHKDTQLPPPPKEIEEEAKEAMSLFAHEKGQYFYINVFQLY